MGIIVSLDKNGKLVYDGMLTSKEKATVDEIVQALKTEIPQIEGDLAKEFGKSVLYKYYLGNFLSDLLERYNVSNSERRKFWNEIKDIATKETRIRDEGKSSLTRSFYEQCYVLSRFDFEIVEKLSWRKWQDLLDRVSNREDERIFEWIRVLPEKISDSDWREFEKGLNAFLKGKDTSVFSNEELFAIYNSILDMGKYWNNSFDVFEKENPKSAKIKTKAKRSQRYYKECLNLKRELRQQLNENIFSQAFDLAMK